MKTLPDLARRRAALLLFAAAGVGARAAEATAFDLAALMALLARKKSGEARFSEQRFVAGLDAPLRSSGTLAFAAPDRMERRTLEPRPDAMIVDGNRLTLTRAGRTRQLALDASGEMAAIVEAMRSTLVGNAAALQRYFKTSVSGEAERWTLDLLPLDAGLAAQLRSARISGRQGEVRSVEMELAGGDRSVMTIEPLPAPAASAAAR